eukprot:COSAG05_NODE_2598_length_2859_cov_9.278623_3_plen_92_part_00
MDKVTLRQTLNECDVEGKDQDLYMASCVQLMKMLAEGHPDVAGIKLLGEFMDSLRESSTCPLAAGHPLSSPDVTLNGALAHSNLRRYEAVR